MYSQGLLFLVEHLIVTVLLWKLLLSSPAFLATFQTKVTVEAEKSEMLPRFPKPPSVKQLKRHIPRIDPIPKGTHRPFWSVMIPSFNRPDYLRKTLKSVLDQDPGPEHMQIEVVDNRSTVGDIEELVRDLGGNRVQFYRHSQNIGMVGNWNFCLKRARGYWVHILHDDDTVLPGFYKVYQQTIEVFPKSRLILGPVIQIDENDRQLGIFNSLQGTAPSPLYDFPLQQASRQLGQFAAIVVRRESFEEAGGFCDLFKYVADWDMWFRVGQTGLVVGTCQPYACYRVHSASDTSKLLISGSNIEEIARLIPVNLARLAKTSQPNNLEWRSRLAQNAEIDAWRLDAKNCTLGRLNQSLWAWKLEPNWRRLVLLCKSWLKHQFSSQKLKSITGAG